MMCEVKELLEIAVGSGGYALQTGVGWALAFSLKP